MAAAAATTLATVLVAWSLWIKALDEQVLEPIDGFANALANMSADRPMPAFPGLLAPAMEDLQQRLQQACSTVQNELKVSRANLVSAEAAFGRLNSVLQSLDEGVLVVNREGRVVLANAAARRAMPHDGDWLGRPVGSLFEGQLADAMLGVQKQCADGSLRGLQHRDLVQGDRFFGVSATDVTHGIGDAGFDHVVVVKDVTNEHEVNRLKDRLLSSISHELRTPLTNMVSFCEILTHMTPDQEADWREFVGILNTESIRLKDLVDSVFDFCQIEAGELEWQVERQDTRPVLRTVAEMFQGKADAKGLQVELELPEEEWIAEFDLRRLLLAAARILDNAIKFTPEGGQICIDMAQEADLISFRVADSGPGIATEDRERVFERFNQLGDIATDKPEGAGLGLSISQELLGKMGGQVRCEDSPLGGVRVVFTLPMAPVHTHMPGQQL